MKGEKPISSNTQEIGIVYQRSELDREKHPNSLKLQRVQIEEFSQTFNYRLKDITKLDDFNQVFDWENSSFYQERSENLNKT